MKKLFALGLVLVGVFALSACDLDELKEEYLDSTDSVSEEFTYARLDINPSIEFIVDEDENVVSYKLLNEDAQTVAADLELEGLPIEEALELYLDEAIELGFLEIDEENQIVVTTSEDVDEDANGEDEADEDANGEDEADEDANGEDEADEDANGEDEADEDANGDDEADEDQDESSNIPYEKLRDRMKEHVQTHLEDRGIGAQIRFGDIDDELLELAEEYNIGFGRLKMIQAAVENDEDLDFETAIEMEMGDIMQIVRNAHHEHMEEFRNEMRDSMRERGNDMRDRMKEDHPRFFDDDTDEEDTDEEDTDDENTDEENDEEDNNENTQTSA